MEGGIWVRGRHNRAEGFLADIEKYFKATLAVWTVLRITERQLNLPSVERMVQLVQDRIGAKSPPVDIGKV